MEDNKQDTTPEEPIEGQPEVAVTQPDTTEAKADATENVQGKHVDDLETASDPETTEAESTEPEVTNPKEPTEAAALEKALETEDAALTESEGPQTVAEAADAVSIDEETETTTPEAAGPSIADEAASEAQAQEGASVHKQSMHVPVAIVAAIFVALALIGLAYSAYLSTNNDDTTDDLPTVQTEEVAEPLAPTLDEQVDTADEAQNAIDDLESELNTLSEDDFNDSSLSDQALEL